MNHEETQRVAETAEAICGALHRYAFEHMGDTNGGASSWFHRGIHPKDVRIEVVRSLLAPMVLVNVEWRNAWRGKGRKTLQVDVRGAKDKVFLATEQAVLRCLELYRDAVQETGVAGPAPETVVSTAHSAVPDNEQDETDAGL